MIESSNAPADRAAQRVPIAAITGGRRGIGRAGAGALARAGFDVIVVDLEHDDDTTATLAEITAAGRQGRFLRGDIAEIAKRDQLADAIFGAFGTLDCLVNNAGVFADRRGADLLEVTPESYDRVMNVNLRGTFFLTQAIARRMVAEVDQPRPLGRSIITITSGVVGRPRMDLPEYSFSKTGLSLMSQAFALRLGRHGINTHEIRPGVTRTGMSRDVWDTYDQLIAEGRFPIGRIGQPEDVGKAIVLLATGWLAYSTGGHIYVDGGFHIPASQVTRRDPPTRGV